MQEVLLPAGWEHGHAPVATLLDVLGPALPWWGAWVLLGGVALLIVRRRPRLAVALAAGGALALGVAANGLVDDAYIAFRYAANLVAGYGPVFNPGVRIEGASSGGWIVLIAAAARLSGAPVGAVARVLSLVASTAAVVAAGWAVARWSGREAGARAAVWWALLPTPALYAATGMETAAFGLGLWLAVGAAGGGGVAATVAAALLLATVRPEGPLLALLALLFWPRLGTPARRVALATLAVGVVAALARTLYYGLPVPRAALVKGVLAPAGPLTGLAYLGAGAILAWPLLAAAGDAARGAPRRALVVVPAALLAVPVVLGGGDWMPGSRYLLPLLVALVTLAARPCRLRGAGVLALALVWTGLLLLPVERAPALPLLGSSWRAMAEHRVQSRWWEALGTWLGTAVPPRTVLACGPAGAVPAASGLPTFDLYGLSTPVWQEGEGAPGHRLWGLDQAVAEGCELIYPGRPLPQDGDTGALLAAATAQMSDEPEMLLHYRPLLLRHPPEYHVDVVADVLWVRAGSGLALSAPQRTR